MSEQNSTSDDLVVVGGGLAGYSAAVAGAHHDPSASIRLLCLSEDWFRTHSGLIDVLGYLPASDDPVSNPFSAVEDLPAGHWYSKLGPERLREALTVFDERTEYKGGETEENALFPTAVGTLKPAARYPESTAAGVASDRRPMRLVGFDQLPDLDGALAAERLHDQLPYDVSGTSITTGIHVNSVPSGPAVADALDADAETPAGESARDALAAALRSELDIEPRLGVPAVLGEDDAAEIRAELEEDLHAELFEIPIGPPSVPGRRLEAQLRTAAEEAGVTVETNMSVSAIETADGAVDAVQTGSGIRNGDAFVLATGGIQAGGLESTRTEIHEPLFDCSVSAPSNRQEWVENEFLGDHEAVRVGVETDERLRPVQSDEPQYSNLYAAGQILETTNVIAEQSTDGVAILTGYEAARQAADH